MHDDTSQQRAHDAWSVSTHDLHETLITYRTEDRPAVVATVVAVEGSAYRRPGAMMLIDPGETSFGAITAGCLEDSLRQLAVEVAEQQRPILETFDLMDDDGQWGLGLGCNGIIDILLEPLDDAWNPIVEAINHREPIAMATIIASSTEEFEIGARAIFADSTFETVSSRPPLPESIQAVCREPLIDLRDRAGTTTISLEESGLTVLLDWQVPAPELLLFGSQPDINPVATIGHAAGFHVRVASPRGARAHSEQFPAAHAVESTHPMELGDRVDDSTRTYAVLMSHNLVEDALALASLLDTSVPYIGVMGPRERFDELREELITSEDRELTRAELDRIATPVGLDLGGGEPMQIALSIVSEALAVHHGRSGGRLQEQEGPIHDRINLTQIRMDNH